MNISLRILQRKQLTTDDRTVAIPFGKSQKSESSSRRKNYEDSAIVFKINKRFVVVLRRPKNNQKSSAGSRKTKAGNAVALGALV